MGACGYYISGRAVFFLTAALVLPALVALPALMRLAGPGPPQSSCGSADPERGKGALRRVLIDRALLIFGGSVMLFTLGNAAMLPLVANALTRTVGDTASLVIAASIVLPQLVVAVVSPAIGRLAENKGRRVVLLLGFCTLPIRGCLFAVANDPILVVLVQVLDGLAAACLGVLVPLVTSDVAGRSGHFNLALGFIGLAIGIGATVSTSLAGSIADRWGQPTAFASLAVAGLAAMALAWGAMPETRATLSPALSRPHREKAGR
jgi:MFS family permease